MVNRRIIVALSRNAHKLLLIAIAVLFAVYIYSAGAWADSHAIEELLTWMPFILKGFWINLVISVLAMLLGTVLGICLGLLELSPLAVVRKPAYFVMNVFRNTPWLVILFIAMFIFPFEFSWKGRIIDIPNWIPAIVSFA